jgi:hypothetical protein
LRRPFPSWLLDLPRCRRRKNNDDSTNRLKEITTPVVFPYGGTV